MRPTLKALQEGSSRGNLQIFTTAMNRPIEGATVTISYTGEPDNIIERLTTDASGQTEVISLPTPPIELSLSPGIEQPYSEYTVQVLAEGYEPFDVSGTEILQDTTSVQPVRLNPVTNQTGGQNIVIPAHTLYGDYPPKIAEAEIKPVGEPGEIVLSRVVVPETVVVHNGVPTDSTAQNYYVPYRDYIKNVASSEIYATWPRATIVANVLAIMSFTLNRVYTEWYRNKMFDFTITSSTAFDHKWIPERNIFDSISEVVDEIFDQYLSRPDVKQPILTQYCDGQRSKCPEWMSLYRKPIKNGVTDAGFWKQYPTVTPLQKVRRSKVSAFMCIQPDGPARNSPVQRAKHAPFFALNRGQKILGFSAET